MKKRVTGLGGVFFKAEDPKKLKDWYSQHLGLDTDEYGANFFWIHPDHPSKKARTVWGPFEKDTPYFNPSAKSYMFNYRVENLEELLDKLRKEGVEVVGNVESYPYGKFGWIMDPEGNKIELWEPIDEEL